MLAPPLLKRRVRVTEKKGLSCFKRRYELLKQRVRVTKKGVVRVTKKEDTSYFKREGTSDLNGGTSY